MTALNDAERAAQNWTSARPDRPALVRSSPPAETAAARISKYYPAWLPSRRFIAAVIAIGGMQLLATMDSTVAIVALPKIQNDLSLSDAGRSWVITAYVLTFGGLMLLGGRLGDTIGRKRTFIVGVALFTISSVLCAVAWDEATMVIARLLQGIGSAIASPTGLALVATTFPKGPARNFATAVFAAMTAVGSVMGLVVGGALTEVSWRLAFLVNVPIGLVMIYLARTALRETNRERMKLDATGAMLATLACTAAVYAFSMGPEKGWVSVTTIGSGAVAMAAALAFVMVERTAENPVVPFDLFRDRNRLVTFVAIFLAGGLMFSLTVCIGLYVQDILGYSALRAGLGFIPFVIAMGIGLGVSSQLVSRFSPRVLTIGGGLLLFWAMISGWAFMHRGVPYFPNLVVPVIVGGIGIGICVVPLTLAAIAGVGFDRIGPVSAIALMLQSLGGPLVLAVIQAVITSRTLYMGGTTGPVKSMNEAQLSALDNGY
ncbi:MAG: hypothetical protein QOC58_1494, partial [Mycobacterium sp.]|nr:hypothetical protein [Mycobacterium sp.]